MLGPQEMEVARAAAAALASEMPEGFAPSVEAEIATTDGGAATYEPATLIALGGLVVSATSLAWTIYKDLRKQAPQPAAAVVERRVRMRFREQGVPENPKMARIIEVVVAEVIRADPT